MFNKFPTRKPMEFRMSWINNRRPSFPQRMNIIISDTYVNIRAIIFIFHQKRDRRYFLDQCQCHSHVVKTTHLGTVKVFLTKKVV